MPTDRDLLGEIRALRRELLATAARLDRIDALHSEDDHGACRCCGEVWPCETARIVREDGRG